MAGPVKKHSGKLLFPGSGSRRKWFAQFNTARFIRNVLVTVICLAGMGLSVWYFRFDLDNSVRQLQETPFGYVYWTTGTIGRQSAGRTEERLEKFAQIYNGDIISTAPFSGAKISFVNGEILELAEQTVVRITYSLNETPYFELLDGDIHIQSGWNTLTVSAVQSSVVQGTTVQSKPIKTLLNPRTSADIRTEGDFSVRLFRGSGVLSREEQTSDIAEGQAFKIDFDNFTLSKLPVLMETPRNGTRILRTTPGIAPVKFQWSGGVIADAENAGDVIADDTGNADSGSGDTVTLVLSRTRDFSDPVETWTGADENSVEFDLAEGIYYWTLSQNGNSGAADSGSLEIIYSTGSIALSPSAGSIETQYPGQNEVRFHWTVPDEAEAVLLEVADNPEMSRPRIRQLVRRTGGGYGSYASTDIGPGKWYWRVYPVFTGDVSEGENNLAQIAGNHGYWRIRPVNTNVMADNSPSQVNPFTVAESFDTPAVLNQSDILINAVAGYSPVIVYPPDNYTVESSRTPDLVFAWKNPVLFNARFQVAERSDFTGTMLMDEDVYGSSIQSVFLEPGAYYWRVTGSGPAGPGESRPSRLVVEPLLTAPKLNTPAENASISMADSISVIFSWTKANYADYYMFRLYTEGKTDPLTEITSLQNTSIQVAFDPNTTGNFRWTVQGFTSPTGVSSLRKGLITEGNFAVIPRTRAVQAGSQTAWAVPRIENIEIKQGEVQSPITLKYPAIGTSIPGLEILRSPPTVQWTASEQIKNVQLLISSTTNPAADLKAQVVDANAGSGAVYLPPLESGRWYWIIRADTLDKKGATSGEIFWFNVDPIPQLPAIQTIQPEDNSVIGIEQLTRDRSIMFRWEPVEGANAYIFNLYKDGTPPQKIADPDPMEARTYVFNNLTLLSEGDYYWQVEAISRNDNGIAEQRGITELHPFKIQIQRSTGLQTQSQGTLYGQ